MRRWFCSRWPRRTWMNYAALGHMWTDFRKPWPKLPAQRKRIAAIGHVGPRRALADAYLGRCVVRLCLGVLGTGRGIELLN